MTILYLNAGDHELDLPRKSAGIRRIAAFAALCEKAGKPCHVFPGRAEEEVRSRAGRLSAWLAGLPAHVAIFAANDFTAKGVVEAAAGLHLRCPRDFTLVGVDAIPETLADMTSPGISSVELDFELAGYLAAKLLDAEISRAGALARLPDSRADGGKHLAHGGEFVLTANGAAMSDYSSARRGYLPPSAAFALGAAARTNAWWTGEAFWNGKSDAGGYATRFFIPWAAMALPGVPERVGLTVSFQDDDNGGERDHTLYWTGSHYLPFRNESAFGDIVFEGAPSAEASSPPNPPAVALPQSK